MIALFYAMPSEIASLIGDAAPQAEEAGIKFYDIRPGVMACCGGVGKVNAAMAAQKLIDRYHPDLILNAGVAGCFEEVPIGTLVLAEGFMQHDFDTSAVDGPDALGLIATVNRKVIPTADFEKARAAMDQISIPYRTGLVATGDWFAVPGERVDFIRENFHPLLIEMEGCAVAQVCWRNGVKCMAIKSVSDCVTSHHDYFFNFPTAMRDLNAAVLAFLDHLKLD